MKHLCALSCLALRAVGLDVLIQRHGQSMNNVGHKCDVVDTQLTGDGKGQAEEAANFVAANLKHPPNISFSSCLMRAMQTAAITFRQTVHVADFIPEDGFGFAPSCSSGKGSCALQPSEQVKYIASGRKNKDCVDGAPTPEVEQRLSWNYLTAGEMPEDYSMTHSRNYTSFLSWLWSHHRVRDLVRQSQNGVPAMISITTHGGTLHEQILPPDWHGWPGNAAIYKARLPLLLDDHGTVLGFKNIRPTNVTCWYGTCSSASTLVLV